LLQERLEQLAELLGMRVGASCTADFGFVNALLVPKDVAELQVVPGHAYVQLHMWHAAPGPEPEPKLEVAQKEQRALVAREDRLRRLQEGGEPEPEPELAAAPTTSAGMSWNLDDGDMERRAACALSISWRWQHGDSGAAPAPAPALLPPTITLVCTHLDAYKESSRLTQLRQLRTHLPPSLRPEAALVRCVGCLLRTPLAVITC
jgi:hypothetical protein